MEQQGWGRTVGLHAQTEKVSGGVMDKEAKGGGEILEQQQQ